MAYPYALRAVVLRDEDMQSLRSWIAEKSPGHLVVRHEGDSDEARPHWHALLWSDKKDQAFRLDFKKGNPAFVGNRSYSLTQVVKKKDDDPVAAYERYMCHGACEGDPVDVVMCHGLKYTPEWFQEQNRLYYAARREFAKKEKKAADTVSVVNEIEKICRSRGLSSREEIARAFIQYNVERSRPINLFYGKSVINTVSVKIGGRVAEDELVDALVRF